MRPEFYELSTGNQLMFTADKVRKERTGVHAVVIVGLNRVALSYDEFNVGRREERIRLANDAWKKLGTVDQKAWTQNQMHAALDAFCYDLWERWVESQVATNLVAAFDAPLEFAVKPYVIHGGGTIIYGPGGSGKTYTAMLMHRAMEGFCDFWPAMRLKPLFIQLERSEDTFGRRIRRLNEAIGLNPDTPMFTLAARGKSLSDVADICRRHVEKDGVDCGIVDSISRAGAGALVEDRAANQIMDMLNGIFPTWAALAHTSHEGKDDPGKSHIFGAAAFEWAADVVVQLVGEENRERGTLGVMMQIVKANDMPKYAPEFLSFQFDEQGLTGCGPATKAEFIELPAYVRGNKVDRVRRYLLTNGEADIGTIAKGTDIKYSTVSQILTTGAGFVRTRKDGRNQFWGVMQFENIENTA